MTSNLPSAKPNQKAIPCFRATVNGLLLPYIQRAFLRSAFMDNSLRYCTHILIGDLSYEVVRDYSNSPNDNDPVIISYQEWKNGKNYAIIRKSFKPAAPKRILTDSEYQAMRNLFNECNDMFEQLSEESKMLFYDRLFSK